MWQVPHGGASCFLARAQAHMPAARVPAPTPSPDGLCQASSAAFLTPQQLPGQGHARTQLARVPPSLGAAGVLRGTGGCGWMGRSFHRDLISLSTWWQGGYWGSEHRAGGVKARTEEPPWVSFNPAASHQVHKLVLSHSYCVLGRRDLGEPL